MKSIFNKCIVVMLALCFSLTANATFIVTGISNNNNMGAVSGSGTYNFNSNCTLTASPHQNCHFVNWSNGSTDNPLNFTVTSDTMFVATFAKDQHKLTVQSNNIDLGTVTGSGSYDHGSEIEITANLVNHHYVFSGWSNGATTPTTTINLTSDSTITAFFAPKQHKVQLSVNNPQGGSVSGNGEFDYGSLVTVTATANINYVFQNWSNGNKASTFSFILDRDTEITANFAAKQFFVSALVNDYNNGIVTGSGPYIYNSNCTLTASPHQNCHFVNWSNGSTDNPLNFTVTSDTMFVANFAKNQYKLTVQSSNIDLGTVTGSGSYDHGSEIEITANLVNHHYVFSGWSNGDTTPTTTINLTSDSTITAFFAPVQHKVQLSVNNPQGGSVSGNGEFDYGSLVTVTATANINYVFQNWSNGNKASTFSFILDRDTEITANFAAKQFFVSALVNDYNNGIVTGSGPYIYNSNCTLTASPHQNCHFVNWSNGSTDNPLNFTVTSDTMFVANFAKDQHKLTVQSSNIDLGTVTGSGSYDHGSEIEITANLVNPHYVFSGWSNGDTTPTTTINLTSDSTITALFAPEQHKVQLSVNNPQGGSVSGNGEFDYGSIVTVTATANTNYVFKNWSNGDTTSTFSFMLDRDTVITAIFGAKQVVVVALANDTNLGYVDNSGIYYYGNVVSLSALPKNNCHFVGWSNGGTGNVQVVTAISDTVIVANFAKDQHKLTVQSSNIDLGTVTGSGSYDHGSEIEITANLVNPHYVFSGWSNGNTTPTTIINLTSDSTITALFAPKKHSVQLSVNNPQGGSVSGNGKFDYGSLVTVTATANTNYVFQNWSNGDTTSTFSFILDRDTEITANFAARQVVVVALANDTNLGSVKGSGIYDYDSIVSLSASPKDNCHFVGWNNGSTANPLVITVTSDTAFVANFAVVQHNLDLRVNDAAKGFVSGGGNYNHGSTVTVTATSNPNYVFQNWSNGETNPIFSFTLDRDSIITAIFVNEQFTVSAVANDTNMGFVTGSGEYEYLNNCALFATPYANYHFVGWSNGYTANPLVVTVTSDTDFVADFSINQHNLTAISNDNTLGTVIGSGTYDYGTLVTVIANPANSHCVFTGWSNGDTSCITTVNLTKDSTITANFTLDRHTVRLIVNDTAKGYIVCGEGEYNHGDTVTVTAATKPHNMFKNWSNGISSPTFNMVLDKDTTITAYFENEQFIVTVVANDNNMGTVTGSGTFVYSGQDTLVATPTANHHFIGWSNGVTDSILIVTVTSDTLFVASFGTDYKHNLTVFSNDKGLGTVTGSGTYDHGTQVEIIATTVNPQAIFLYWSNGTTSPVATIDLTKDSTVTAIFVLNEFNISLAVNDENMGSVTGAGSYSYGDVAILSAIPASCYHFICWSDSVTDNPRSIIVNDSLSLTAFFDVNYYTIGIAENDTFAGKAFFDLSDLSINTIACGSQVTIKAEPSLYYRFVEWSDGVRDSVRLITVTSDTLIIALFEPSCGDYADFPVKFRYNGLIMIDLDSIISRGYNPTPEQVMWYQVVDNVDSLNVSFPDDDHFICNGYYLSLTAINAAYGKYYAVIDVSDSTQTICSGRMKTVVIDYSENASHAIVQMAPTSVQNDNLVSITGLIPDENTTITINDTAGKVIDIFKTSGLPEYSIRVKGTPGVYMVRVTSETVDKTFKIIIAR